MAAVRSYERDLLFLLNDIGRLLRTEADRRARVHGLTRAQWGILLRLEREPGQSQRELAEALEVEAITVARLVDRLEKRGLVERRADRDDRRVWRLHLLPTAGPVLSAIHDCRADMTASLTAAMQPEELTAVTDALVQMKSMLTADRRGDKAEVA